MAREKETREEKLKRKQYFKMNAGHSKKLVSLAKNATPFQYDDGIALFVEHLRWMRDYYKIGYNVFGMECKDEDPVHYKNIPTRFESLDAAIKEYEAIENCYDNYFTYHETGGKENGKGYKYGILSEDGKTAIEKISDHWIEPLFGTHEESHKLFRQEQEQHRENFIKIIKDNIRSWWD